MRVLEDLSSLLDEYNAKLKMVEESVMLSLADHAVPEALFQDVRNIFQQASETLMRDSGVRGRCLLNSPVEAALSNVIIIAGVFKHLDFESLKHCRKVCRSWRDTGTKELITRDCCQITIRENPDNKWLVANPHKSVQDLICVMDKSEAFPSSRFQVLPSMFTSMESLIPFFEMRGDSVQSLNIVKLKSLTNLAFVLKQCPNMVNLKLKLSGYYFCDRNYMYERFVEPFFQYFLDTENERPECKVILPNLRSLEVTNANDLWGNAVAHHALGRVITTLIKASPNLLELKNFQSEMADALILSNRIDLVKAIHFKPNKENLGRFLALANHEPRLKELDIIKLRMDPRGIQTIQKLLQSSHTSLITLRTKPLGILGNLNVPGPFETLENLTVLHHQYFSSSLLPGGIGLSARMFPKLKTIVFEIEVKRLYVNSLFRFEKEDFENDTIPTVSTVEVRIYMDKHELYLIGTTFPNLSRLSLKNTYYPVMSFDNRIWELLPNSLTTLELFDSTFLFCIEENNFDCVFTGLPLATCKILAEMEAQAGTGSKVKRTNSWIGQSKNLKKLSFILHKEGSYTNHADWTLTTVTAEYAFTQVLQLQVVIGYDWGHPMKTVIEKKLEPLKPFVAFQHKPAVV